MYLLSLDLPVLDISCRGDRIVHGFLCRFLSLSMFQELSVLWRVVRPSLLCIAITFHRVNGSRVPATSRGHLRGFCFLATMRSAAVSIPVRGLVGM